MLGVTVDTVVNWDGRGISPTKQNLEKVEVVLAKLGSHEIQMASGLDSKTISQKSRDWQERRSIAEIVTPGQLTLQRNLIDIAQFA